ncbi:hypothetical protein ACFL04_02865 [Patescibacteria group bacterium]
MIRRIRRRVKKRKYQILLLLIISQLVFPQFSSAQVVSADQVSLYSFETNGEVIINHLPENEYKPASKTINLTMTAYSSTPDQTSGDPFITASGARVRDGVVAHNYLPIGTKVRFPEEFGDQVFTVLDRLNPRHGQYVVDRWTETREEAIQWGARVVKMEII